MHPSLPPGYGRKWKEMERAQEITRKVGDKQNKHRFTTQKKQNLDFQPTQEKFPPNEQNKKKYIAGKESKKSTKFVTDDVLRSFGILASDYSVSVTILPIPLLIKIIFSSGNAILY